MFDGSFKSSRKVNLSGRKKPAHGYGARLASLSSSRSGGAVPLSHSVAPGSKEELMLQNRLAREERHALKKRTAASTRIQALYRRVSAARRARIAVFERLEQELTQVVLSTDIQTVALPATQITRFLRQFLFVRPRTTAIATARATPMDRLRKVQDYLVFMLLVSCLRGSGEAGTNFLAVQKDASWVYQAMRVVEFSLQTLVQEELPTSASSATVAMNPYLLVVDTFTTVARYAEGPSALNKVLYQLSLSANYGIFDAMSSCIQQQTVEHASRVENDRLVQVIAGVAAQALRIAVQKQHNGAEALLRQFAFKILLTPSSTSSPVTMYVVQDALAVGQLPTAEKAHEVARFWASAVQYLRRKQGSTSSPSVSTPTFTWQERAIAVGNLVELVTQCSFQETLVGTVSLALPDLISSTLVQWAFDVKQTEQDAAASLHDYGMDEDEDEDASMPTMAPVYLTVENVAADDEARRGLEALGESAAVVKTQWQQLCHSNFSARCLDVLLTPVELASELSQTESAVSSFSHVLSTLLLASGRRYVLSVATTFATPPPAVFALLSAMTVEQFAGGESTHHVSLINSLWQWMKPQIDSASASSTLPNGPATYTTAQLEVLLLFNLVYSNTLLGLDDEAFYDREWPLALREVETVVTFLKKFIFDTCWTMSSTNSLSASSTDAMDPTKLTLFAAVVSSVKLFNQLYDRDSRRGFMPDGAWLWPAMPPIKETVDLASMQEDGNSGSQAIYMLMSGAASSPHTRAALILVTIPQVLSFNERVLLFQKLLDEDKAQLGHIREEFAQALQVRVRRDEIVDDSFEFFEKVCESRSPAALKSRIKVTFVNEQGLEEAGIDGGGVFKEYVDCLTKSAFSPEYGFFLATDQQLLYPNPAAHLIADSRKEVLSRFRFLGRVLAKAVYENILVEPQFAAFFLNKLLGKFNYIDDLQSLDPELYTSLMRLKHYDGQVADLALSFSVNEMEFGQTVTRNLVPDGANVPVTNENRIRYMHVLANYKLNVLSAMESAAFLKGFRDLIPGTWLQMFAPAELQMLIGGTATNIDMDDWQQHTLYGGGYHPSQPVIRWFWELVREDFSAEDRAALLKFITSCSRQPLLGFQQLAPQICIHQVRVSDDERLPSSATCMNLLKLPSYSNKQVMREKLLYAIRSNAGFDLS